MDVNTTAAPIVEEEVGLEKLIGGDAEAPAEFVFRHKAVRHYMISREDYTQGYFEFKDFQLELRTQEERDEFIRVMSKQPAREYTQIVEINTAAAAAAERSLAPKPNPSVVRGAQSASDILTSKDRERIQQARLAQAAAAAKAGNPLAGGAKPTSNT